LSATLDIAPPPLWQFLGETGALVDRLIGGVTARRIGARHERSLAGGPPVMVFPGFLADDRMTRLVRRAVRAAGRRATGWGVGQNRGVRADILDLLSERVDSFAPNERVALVGWSLGGLMARELAKRMPDRIDRVVTMGSPFSGSLRANRVWKVYERIAGHSVDGPPIRVELSTKPPVPTIAIWSARDGIVAAPCARGREGESDLAVQVNCRHMSFVSAPRAIEAMLAALSVPVER
jgi:pimeloyl-ACP methyl ester carboxylesterase